jgi:hypothetical protein
MILLDTHALIWLAREPAKLSRNASEAIRNLRNRAGWRFRQSLCGKSLGSLHMAGCKSTEPWTPSWKRFLPASQSWLTSSALTILRTPRTA